MRALTLKIQQNQRRAGRLHFLSLSDSDQTLGKVHPATHPVVSPSNLTPPRELQSSAARVVRQVQTRRWSDDVSTEKRLEVQIDRRERNEDEESSLLLSAEKKKAETQRVALFVFFFFQVCYRLTHCVCSCNGGRFTHTRLKTQTWIARRRS